MNNISIEAIKIWYLFSFFLGIWTCFTLLMSKQGDGNIKKTMMLFVALLVVPSLNTYFALVNGKPIWVLSILSQNLTLAYGPLLFLLLKQILLQPIDPRKHFWHFLPFTLLLFDRLAGNYLWQGYGLVAFVFAQVFSYLAVSGYLLTKHRKQLLKLTRQHKNTTYYWLVFLAMGLVCVMCIDLSIWIFMYIYQTQPSLFLISLIASGLSLYVNAIALFAAWQPSIFTHAKDDSEADEDKDVADRANKDALTNKLRYVELSPEVAAQLDQQLNDLIIRYQPHLDEAISLGKLAALLGISRNQLSELLNIHKQVKFYDFINNLRFQESIDLIADRKLNLTIIDIAYRAGFNNKNSFYKVFKQKTGLTPTQYKKQLVA